jgi:hypothetical protein
LQGPGPCLPPLTPSLPGWYAEVTGPSRLSYTYRKERDGLEPVQTQREIIKYLFYYFLYYFIELIIILYVHTISQNLSSHAFFIFKLAFFIFKLALKHGGGFVFLMEMI